MAHYESFLRDKFKELGYPNAPKATSDAKQALEHYKNLKPAKKPFVYPDGNTKELLSLEGTVPVNYRGVEYNIPIGIWLQDRHPYLPPICYVVPTATMQIKVGKHVDVNGRIYLPFLTDWKHPQSDLYGLIQVLCLMFAEDPPVYARASNAPPPGQPPPQRPQYPHHTPYPASGYNAPYPAGQPPMPMPGGGMPGGGMPLPRGGMHGAGGGMPVPGGGGGMPGAGMQQAPSNTPLYPYPMTSQPEVVRQPSPNRGVRQPPSRPPPPSPSRLPAPSSYPPPCGGGFPMPGMTQTSTQAPYPAGASTTTTTAAMTSAPNSVAGLARREPNSFKISDEMMKASLKSAIEGKIKRRLDEMFAQSQAEMASLKKTETDLTNGKNKLEGMIRQIETEEAEVTKDIAMLTQKNSQIEELVSGLQQKSDKLNVDDAVVATTPLYNQILELYAEENALDDTMYYLGEALRREKIELDVFLKHVRSLSRRQFMCRALLQKARMTAGLSEL